MISATTSRSGAGVGAGAGRRAFFRPATVGVSPAARRARHQASTSVAMRASSALASSASGYDLRNCCRSVFQSVGLHFSPVAQRRRKPSK